ncbi:MAG: hypothetical protein ACK41U_00110 [Paracoccus sp. (in: a-proteobacteria)]|uniref:hypothetical protein n=1 Tax=Paracoccus sp. TaxID=267 RepID=UPI00391CDC71
MPIDIATLFEPWVFKSESNGSWEVGPYSINAMVSIEEFFEEGRQDYVEGVKDLMRVVCSRHKDVGDGEIDAEPSDDDMSKFSMVDIEEFSREFLKRNTVYAEKPDEILTKKDDQSDSEFLMKSLNEQNSRESERYRETFSGHRSRLGDIMGTGNRGLRSLTQGLLKQNEDLERAYGSRPTTIFAPPPLVRLPPNPENPTYKSNQHLADMNARLDNLISFGEAALQKMHGLEVAAAEFLNKFSIEARNNSRAAKAAIIVGALAVVISVGQIAYTEFRRVPQDTAAMDTALASVLGDINRLRISLTEDLSNARTVQEVASETVADAIGATVDTNTALLHRIDQLLRQQQERDQAILDALEALAATAGFPSE